MQIYAYGFLIFQLECWVGAAKKWFLQRFCAPSCVICCVCLGYAEPFAFFGGSLVPYWGLTWPCDGRGYCGAHKLTMGVFSLPNGRFSSFFEIHQRPQVEIIFMDFEHVATRGVPFLAVYFCKGNFGGHHWCLLPKREVKPTLKLLQIYI